MFAPEFKNNTKPVNISCVRYILDIASGYNQAGFRLFSSISEQYFDFPYPNNNKTDIILLVHFL